MLTSAAEIVGKVLASIDHRPLEEIIREQVGVIQSNDFTKIYEEVAGFGPLTPLLNETSITEIIVNNFETIYIERNGRLEKHESSFVSPVTYHRVVQHLLRDIDRIADQRHPIADGTLACGARVHIVVPPVTSHPVVTIRKHGEQQLTLHNLIENKMLTEMLAEKLRRTFVEQRKNILIAGPTGSGKTTLLRALLLELNSHERVITIEDTEEIKLRRPNCISLLSRFSPDGLVPEVSLHDLVKATLRMRPDRLVLGEIRAHEAAAFVEALSTGHQGSVSSIHGATSHEALHRLENLISRLSPQWPPDSIRRLIRDSVDLVVVLGRSANGHRHITQISNISGLESFGLLLDDWVV